ncbi:hypothetical protein F4808DRAFT_376036, partial [Astrocystis sublimbata]
MAPPTMAPPIKPARPAAKGPKGFRIRPKGAGSMIRINQVLNRASMERERAMSSEPSHPPASRPTNKGRSTCPNPRCPNPSAPVDEGCCTACGGVIDSSNIVSEVVFGETSSGAAMVQGSFVAADQGTTRNMAPGIRRLGGLVGDNKEKTLRDAKNMMWGYKSRLRNVSESAIDSAIMIFKLCLSENWLQGRGMNRVVPVCLYAACRRESKCDVMLIDFAELVQINVYDLGHVFKDLSSIYSFSNNGVGTVIPEDLMMRFAEKLDFGDLTRDVAADATRLCQRMGRDWMVRGRRPSGICGACLLMAARMWNFRRTVREVVYVVKVTAHTIEQRLSEFTVTESSNLSIENFLNREFLESRHDPPSFYKATDEWKEKTEKEREESGRKRKRVLADIDGDELDQANGEADPERRLPSASTSMPPPLRPPPDLSKVRPVTEFLPKSFDAAESRDTVVPFDPTQVLQPPPKRSRAARDIVEGLNAEDPTSSEAIDELVDLYSATDADGGAENDEAREEDEQAKGRSKNGRRRNEQGSEERHLN